MFFVLSEEGLVDEGVRLVDTTQQELYLELAKKLKLDFFEDLILVSGLLGTAHEGT